MKWWPRDKSKDTYFSFWYSFPVQFLALYPAIQIIFLSELHTMDMALETRVFLISMLTTGILLFKKMKRMIITWDTDPMGFRWPDTLSRLAEFLWFAIPLAIIIVWGALEINKQLDSSQPQVVVGTVGGKIRSDIIDNYRLKIKPEFPGVKNTTRLRVEYELYKNIDAGSKVNLTIRQGALGYPYIEHVSLIAQHEKETKNL